MFYFDGNEPNLQVGRNPEPNTYTRHLFEYCSNDHHIYIFPNNGHGIHFKPDDFPVHTAGFGQFIVEDGLPGNFENFWVTNGLVGVGPPPNKPGITNRFWVCTGFAGTLNMNVKCCFLLVS